MSIDLFLKIIIILLVILIFVKLLRKIIAIVICLVILYFVYFNFFTWEGAVKFTTFVETLNKEAYDVEIKEVGNSKGKIDYVISPSVSDKEDKVTIVELTCKSYGYVKLCEEYK